MDENGRTVSENKSSYTITGKTGMDIGRYFYIGEYDGGALFVKETI